MASLSGLNNQKLWNMVKTKRLRYLIKNVDKIGTDKNKWCFKYDDPFHVLISSGHTIQFLDDLVQSEKTHKFSNKQFESAAEMFIYLNLCPKFMHNWVKLYVDLLQNGSPEVITQTLNRIYISAREKRDKTIRDITKKIFEKVYHNFALTFSTLDNLNYGIRTETQPQFQDKTSQGIQSNISQETLQTVSNHPIHILDNVGISSPSAFLPFCAFGRSQSTIGDIMDA